MDVGCPGRSSWGGRRKSQDLLDTEAVSRSAGIGTSEVWSRGGCLVSDGPLLDLRSSQFRRTLASTSAAAIFFAKIGVLHC